MVWLRQFSFSPFELTLSRFLLLATKWQKLSGKQLLILVAWLYIWTWDQEIHQQNQSRVKSVLLKSWHLEKFHHQLPTISHLDGEPKVSTSQPHSGPCKAHMCAHVCECACAHTHTHTHTHTHSLHFPLKLFGSQGENPNLPSETPDASL